MRPKLLKSFLLVVLFWFIATTLYWTVADPEKNLESLKALAGLFPFLHLPVPGQVSVLNAWKVQIAVLIHWTAPVLVLSAISAAIGWGATWLLARRKNQERTDRETGTGSFRGITISLGQMPLPTPVSKDTLDLGSGEDSVIDRMTTKEKKLLEDILGILSANEHTAYVSPAIQSGLLNHALNLASKGLEQRRHPGLSAIVAAGHELGNLTAYTKDAVTSEWSNTKNHEREATRLLSSLDSWWNLPEDDRMAVLFAIRYKNNPKTIPDPDGEHRIYRFARDLLDSANDTQEKALAEENQKTLEKHELPDVIFDAFLKGLPTLSFQNKGLPAGVRAVAWKVGSRVYMLEIELRDRAMAKLDASVRAALTIKGPKPKIQPFTVELLKALSAQGWLVHEMGKMKLHPTEALWVIKAGKLEFKGVIVIDIPPDYIEMLPAQDSFYDISVTGSLFQQPGITSLAGTDLGDILRPKSVSIPTPDAST